MEEEEIKITPETGEEKPQQSSEQIKRERILEKSRADYKREDERETQYMNKAIQIGGCVAVFLFCVMNLVDMITMRKIPIELFILFSAAPGTMFTVLGAKQSKSKALFLTCGIILVASGVYLIVKWILARCGVNI